MNLLFKSKLIVVGIAMIFFTFSCSKEKINEQSNVPVAQVLNKDVMLDEADAYGLLATTEASEFIGVRNDFLDLIEDALGNGTTATELRQALLAGIINGDEDQIKLLLFDDLGSADYFLANYNTKRQAFLNQNNVVLQNASSFQCNDNIESLVTGFVDNFNSINTARLIPISNGTPNITPLPLSGAPVACGSYWNQVKLLACVGMVSASTGGLAAVAGTWGCWCTFCTQNSQVATVICAN